MAEIQEFLLLKGLCSSRNQSQELIQKLRLIFIGSRDAAVPLPAPGWGERTELAFVALGTRPCRMGPNSPPLGLFFSPFSSLPIILSGWGWDAALRESN